MADTAAEPRDLAPDLVGVKSRVAWSAIVAGAVIGLGATLVFTLLLGAIGVSLTEAGVRANSVAVGTLVAVLLAIILAMFLAGWVASQLTVGENRQEAALYGLLTWATVTVMSVALVGMGMKAGYFAVVGGSLLAQNSERAPSVDEAARQLGFTQAQIDAARANLTPAAVRNSVEDPEKAAMYTAWTALVGIMLSMGACVGGAVCGRGMAFRLFPVVAARREPATRLIVPTA